MRAVLWSDYICPWCYLGRDRTTLIEGLGVAVEHRAFELHPELPETGVAVRRGGRLAATLDRIAAECAEAGLPFSVPERLPRSRRALETAEVVAAVSAPAFPTLDAALFAAVFVEPRDIADPAVLDELVDVSGADADDVRGRVERGDGAELLERSMRAAREAGVAATPAWVFESGLVIPGVVPREVLTRWIERVRARAR